MLDIKTEPFKEFEIVHVYLTFKMLVTSANMSLPGFLSAFLETLRPIWAVLYWISVVGQQRKELGLHERAKTLWGWVRVDELDELVNSVSTLWQWLGLGWFVSASLDQSRESFLHGWTAEWFWCSSFIFIIVKWIAWIMEVEIVAFIIKLYIDWPFLLLKCTFSIMEWECGL